MDAMDRVALSILIGRTLQGIGCCLVGCCQGEPAEWGIYSAVSKTTVVPVQVFEIIGLFTAWIMIHGQFCKKKYQTGGKSAAFVLIVFGLINFITDVFTVTFSPVFFASSMEGLFGLVNVCVGLVLLYVLDRHKKEKQGHQPRVTAR